MATADGNKSEKPALERDASSRLTWVDLVRSQVGSLRFGTVLVTVHEGRVVQVEKSEKLRLDHADVNRTKLGECAGSLSTPPLPLYEPTPNPKRS